jgi:hypothetical protein
LGPEASVRWWPVTPGLSNGRSSTHGESGCLADLGIRPAVRATKGAPSGDSPDSPGRLSTRRPPLRLHSWRTSQM